jgi:hypothetical protein
MRPIKMLMCTLKKRHHWAIVTGHYLHKKGLKKLPEPLYYEFCLNCHTVRIIGGKENENMEKRES